MLSSILKKSDCAECKFCCSFRRQSLWETPVFTKEAAEKISKLFPKAHFRPTGTNSLTIDLFNAYKTSNSEEEAPCPFLEEGKGCLLPPDLKPLDCSIWPLRIVKSEDSKLQIALTPTCPVINKVPVEKIKELVKNELAQKILDYAKSHPDIIKNSSVFLSNIIYS